MCRHGDSRKWRRHAPIAPALNDPAEEAVRAVRDRLRTGRAVDWGALAVILNDQPTIVNVHITFTQ